MKKGILYSALGAFVLIGTASIVVFMLVVMPSQYRQQAKAYASQLRSAEVGDRVLLGTYEQNNDPSDGAEPIEWIVADRKEDRRMLVSRYALDCMSFSSAVSQSTWDYSTILQWLNGTFYEKAFNEAEKTLICTSVLPAESNPVFMTDAGSVTEEKVFLLSILETYRYLQTAKERQCQPTMYAAAKGVRTDGENCIWWLRSPGFDTSAASRVLENGKINYCGFPVSDDANAVRPCIWISVGQEGSS